MSESANLKIKYKNEVKKLFDTHWVTMLEEDYSEVKIIKGKRIKNKSMKNFQELIDICIGKFIFNYRKLVNEIFFSIR